MLSDLVDADGQRHADAPVRADHPFSKRPWTKRVVGSEESTRTHSNSRPEVHFHEIPGFVAVALWPRAEARAKVMAPQLQRGLFERGAPGLGGCALRSRPSMAATSFADNRAWQ